jgi:hypothetical protein
MAIVLLLGLIVPAPLSEALWRVAAILNEVP